MNHLRTLGCLFVLALLLLLAWGPALTRAASFERSTRSESATPTGCGTWQNMPSPAFNGQLFGLSVLSHDDIWAVGYSTPLSGQRINASVIEHWNGTQWSMVSSPQPGNYRDFLEAVTALSSTNVWAVGAYENARGGFEQPEKTLVEHWNGNAWSVVPSPNQAAFTNALFGIAALSATDIWANGSASSLSGKSKALSEHWDGTRWSIVPAPDPGSYTNGLGSLSALSSSNIWSVGSFSNAKFGLSQTLVEHWNGRQWQVVQSPNRGNLGDALASIAAISAQDIWAVGWYLNAEEELETMTDHWNGSKWSVIPSPNPPGGDNVLHGVAALDDADVWAVGSSAEGPIVFSWDGHHWHMAPTLGQRVRLLWSVAAFSPASLWAVGSHVTTGLIMHEC